MTTDFASLASVATRFSYIATHARAHVWRLANHDATDASDANGNAGCLAPCARCDTPAHAHGAILPHMRTVRYSRTTRTGAYKGTVRCECARRLHQTGLPVCYDPAPR